MPPVLAARRQQSEEGLARIRALAGERLAAIVGEEPLAIYATGSFGRHEATFPGGSDLDVFFLYDPDDGDPAAKLPRLRFIELAAELIRIARDLGFEEFSRDGEYLIVHNVRYIGEQLGSRHEDAENGFTTRLLLLLESEPLFNDALYEKVIADVVGFYFEDFPGSAGGFRPTFLLNDILRFWRTLCLNYEHKRRSKRRLAQDSTEGDEALGDSVWRAESALENFKLRFSRLSTCYSMVAALASEPTPVTAERVIELCRTWPTERWGVAVANAPADARPRAEQAHDAMLELYDQFLEESADKDKILKRLADAEERSELRGRASRYGELVAQLLADTCRDEQRRILLV